ncbi:MAG: retroviral-like aspartic protease family protein [bacterium]|nr:retroviral-like aspartic protease family protein [bacterium]
MGVFDWSIRVSSSDGASSVDIDAIVDTGATYTAVPAGILEQLGIAPKRRLTFELADGRCQVMDVGSARVTINGATEMTPVVFGANGTDTLLGAVTLQQLALAADSSMERLVPAAKLRY